MEMETYGTFNRNNEPVKRHRPSTNCQKKRRVADNAAGKLTSQTPISESEKHIDSVSLTNLRLQNKKDSSSSVRDKNVLFGPHNLQEVNKSSHFLKKGGDNTSSSVMDERNKLCDTNNGTQDDTHKSEGLREEENGSTSDGKKETCQDNNKNYQKRSIYKANDMAVLFKEISDLVVCKNCGGRIQIIEEKLPKLSPVYVVHCNLRCGSIHSFPFNLCNTFGSDRALSNNTSKK